MIYITKDIIDGPHGSRLRTGVVQILLNDPYMNLNLCDKVVMHV